MTLIVREASNALCLLINGIAAAGLLAAFQALSIGEPSVTENQSKGAVAAISVTPDGKQIAIGYSDFYDGGIRFIDTGTGREEFTLPGQYGPVEAIAFSPDGSLVAVGSIWGDADETGTAVWDLSSRKVCFRVGGHKLPVSALAFSPDGKLFAAGDGHGVVKVLDAVKGVELASFAEHRDEISRVTFSPDGTVLATASDDHDIRIWDIKSKKCCATLSAEGTGRIFALMFSSDGKQLLAADNSSSGVLRTWDVATGKQQTCVSFQGKSFLVSCLAISPDHKWVAAGGEDGSVRVWSAESGKEAVAFSLGKFILVKDVAFTPDGRRLVAGGKDDSPPLASQPRPKDQGIVKRWDISRWIEMKAGK